MIKFYREWQRFRKTGDTSIRNFLVVRYLPFARYVASTFPCLHHSVTQDDILSWACFGLIDAVEKFDPRRGIKFETYAIARIRGEIKENFRKALSSTYIKRKKLLDDVYDKLCARLGRPPFDGEMAKELGIDMHRYKTMLSQTLPISILSLDSILDEGLNFPEITARISRNEDFSEALELKEKKELLARAIGQLPAKEKEVMTLYYYEGLTMKEISGFLGITEGRVSQIHASALMRLRGLIKVDKKNFRYSLRKGVGI